MYLALLSSKEYEGGTVSYFTATEHRIAAAGAPCQGFCR